VIPPKYFDDLVTENRQYIPFLITEQALGTLSKNAEGCRDGRALSFYPFL